MAHNPVAAFSCALDFTALNAALEEFSRANLAIELDDALVRAAGSALSTSNNVAESNAAVAIETPQGLVVCRNAGRISLSALHDLRTEEARDPKNGTSAAALSIRPVAGRGLIPTLMPILPGFDMRLVIVGDGDTANATLFFNPVIEAGIAASILAHVKQCIEQPILMLL